MLRTKGHLYSVAARSATIIGSASALICAFPSAAVAQEADAPAIDPAVTNSGEGEIVVTGVRNREERVQDVPIAITVFDANDLREQGINDGRDLQYHTPSLVISDNLSKNMATHAIRGLSNGGGSIDQTSVAVYFADAPSLAPKGGATLYDMESVQVLKGPQGTLFGRSSTSGAVVLTPAGPNLRSFSGLVDVVVGDHSRRELTAMVNIPLIADQVGIRAAVHHQHLGGYTKRLSGEGRNYDETDVTSGRFSLDLRPGSGRFRNSTVIQYDRFNGTSTGQVTSAYDPSLVAFGLPLFVFVPEAAAEFEAELTRLREGGDDAYRRTAGTGPNPEKGDSLAVVNTTSFDVGDIGFTTLTVRNVFSYQRAGLVAARDLDGIARDWDNGAAGLIEDGAGGATGSIRPDPGLITLSSSAVDVGQRVKLYTDEITLNGSISEGLIDWTAGYYYQRQPALHKTETSFNTFKVLEGLFEVFGLDTVYGTLGETVVGGRSKEQGWFGQFTADLGKVGLEGLNFTAGYRYSKSSLVSKTRTVVGFDPVTGGIILSGDPTVTTKVGSHGDNYVFTLDYRINPNVLVYATTRKGYQPGGINLGCDDIDCPSEFAPETVKDIELGAKFDFNLGSLPGRINVAAYRMVYDNIQRSFGSFGGGSPTISTFNVAKAVLKGIEVEATIRPIEDLMLYAGYSYNDAKYTDYIGSDPLGVAEPGDAVCVDPAAPVCNLDLADQPFPGNAKHKINLTARARLPFTARGGDSGDIFFTANLYHQSRQYFGEGAGRVIDYLAGLDPNDQFTPDYVLNKVVSQKGYSTINFRVDWENVLGSGVTASAFLRNATGKLYASGAVPTFITFLGMATRSYGEPRTFGVQLTVPFGRK